MFFRREKKLGEVHKERDGGGEERGIERMGRKRGREREKRGGGGREREREREREMREREREREGDRHTDRHTDTDIQTDTHRLGDSLAYFPQTMPPSQT